jgi:hypothetical protein
LLVITKFLAAIREASKAGTSESTAKGKVRRHSSPIYTPGKPRRKVRLQAAPSRPKATHR